VGKHPSSVASARVGRQTRGVARTPRNVIPVG